MTTPDLVTWFRQCADEIASNDCSRGPGCDLCMGQVWGMRLVATIKCKKHGDVEIEADSTGIDGRRIGEVAI